MIWKKNISEFEIKEKLAIRWIVILLVKCINEEM